MSITVCHLGQTKSPTTSGRSSRLSLMLPADWDNRFANLISITDDLGKKMAHVHWLEHSSKTYLEELSDPRELFMTQLCDDIPFADILGKVFCKGMSVEGTPHATSEPFFYCRCVFPLLIIGVLY